MKNSKWEKYNLTTITPVFIGSDQGSDLSKTTDFIVDGSQIKIIDQRKFETLLGDNVELIDEFVSSIKNNPRSFDLQNFIENKLNASVSELIKTTLDVDGYLSSNSVNTFITTNGKHFIPGSTIKGAIRTSIIYNYLIYSDVGKKVVTDLLNATQNNDPFKEKKKKVNSIYNELFLFKSESFGHDFRHIIISDSDQIEPSDTKITELPRTYMIKDSDKTSQWKQVLKENVNIKFTLKIEEDFNDNFLTRLNSNSEETLIELINNFSKDVIDFELKMYEEFSKKKEVSDKINAAIEFYKWLKNIIEKSTNKFAVMRIGGGKTYFDNSIGLALYKKDKNTFKEFRKLLGFWKHRSGNKSFVEEDSPITRTFIKEQNQFYPIGWVVLYSKNQKEFITSNLNPFFNKANAVSNSSETLIDPMERLKQKFKVTEGKKKS